MSTAAPPAPVRYRRRSERGFGPALRRLLHEIRYPTTRRGKIIAGTLAGLVFAFLSLIVIGAFLLARILTPPHGGEALDVTQLIGTTQKLTFQTPNGLSHNGWFFPGVRGGPVLVLLHGYRSSRSEILALASSLQEPRYNVFVFNLAGHGESPLNRTTLGYEETTELLAALEMLAQRPDVNGKRIGLWGYSLGAHVALSAAVRFSGVKALVLDSVYAQPADMLRLELRRMNTHWVPLLSTMTQLEFRLYTFLYPPNNPERDFDELDGVPKLFVSGRDEPGFAELTRQLFERAPPPKELALLPRTAATALRQGERSEYENRVISFFLTHLPPTAH